MNGKSPAVYESNEQEIAALMDLLRKTGQRLETLTSGEVDTATDPDGRTLLMRGTREQLQQSEAARQAAVLNALPAHIALLDPDGTIVAVNNSWRAFATATSMRGGPGQVVGVNYLAICDTATGPTSQDARVAAEGIRSVLSGSSQSFTFDYEVDSISEKSWFQLKVTPLSKTRKSGVIIKHEDITASKRDQSDLISFASRLTLATEIAKVGVWEWDVVSNVLTWDETMHAIYGFTQTAELSYKHWSAAVHPEDLPEAEAKLQRAIHQRSDQRADFRIITVGGNTRFVSAAQRAVIDQSGNVCRVIGVNVDVTEQKCAEQELRRNEAMMTHLLEHDFLTDLPNKRVMRGRLDQAIAKSKQNHDNVAIFFLNLNGFKHINASLGHLVGDQFLLSTATRLENIKRASDTVIRFGGDKFIVLLPDIRHPGEAAAEAERLLDAVAATQIIGLHELQVSACIGISMYPNNGQDADELIQNADAAMYQAKDQGGSTYQFFHSDMNIRANERQFIEQNLRRAIERNELALHYQPKVDLKSGAITGVEALLRWTHPVRGLISPAAFIPVAEDCGLILPIGAWVLEEACRQARGWLDAGLPKINIAVNVSGIQFQGHRFEEEIMDILGRFRIDPHCLELEVTESLLMKAPEFTATLLQSLRGKGVRVAIDDFGTGYSSLSYLRRFPIDTLKIDQSFVRQIDIPEGVSMVKAIIDLGRNLGMRLIAEGVETELEATTLQGLGCERAQGYYFSRPLGPAQLASLLENSLLKSYRPC